MMGQVANVSQCSTNTKGASEFCTFLSFVGGGGIPVFRGVWTQASLLKLGQAVQSIRNMPFHLLPLRSG